MERIQAINAGRIEWCRADHGIALEQLAQKIGIAPATLTKVMAGEDGLTFSQLRKLADFFGRGALFFLELGPINEAKVRTAQFRTLANQKPELSPDLKQLIERVEQQRTIFLALRGELGPDAVTQFTPPALDGLSIPKAAEATRRWLGLAERNDFDSYRRAVEARGLLVFRSNGYSGKWQIAKNQPILGFSLYDPICPLITIKKQDQETRQSFTLMHELGHLLLHRTSSIDDESDIYQTAGKQHEQEANAFAGHLLVPDSFLQGIRDNARPDEASRFDDWLKPQRMAWGVSSEVILRRLMDVGRLSSSKYAAYRQWQSRPSSNSTNTGPIPRAYRHLEPRQIFGDGYVRTVLDALNSQRITLTKASTYLDSLTIKNLHKLEQQYAGV